MQTVTIVLLFILGIILIIKGGGWFVDASVWFAEVTGIPKFIVGATIVSFATTLPEILVSAFAAYQGHADMAMGNGIGSVNCNTALILALSIIFLGGSVPRRQLAFSGTVFIGASVLLYFFGRNRALDLYEAAALVLMGLASIVYNIKTGEDPEDAPKVRKRKPEKKETAMSVLRFVGGAAAMVVGARLLVDNGELLAVMMGVPDIVISITLISIGTSLPELVTTITAIVKKQSDISVGNIIGANIMNLCVVIPSAALISRFKFLTEMVIDPSYVTMQLPMTVWLSCLAVIPTLILQKTSRWQGILLFISYIAYLVLSLSMV